VGRPPVADVVCESWEVVVADDDGRCRLGEDLVEAVELGLGDDPEFFLVPGAEGHGAVQADDVEAVETEVYGKPTLGELSLEVRDASLLDVVVARDGEDRDVDVVQQRPDALEIALFSVLRQVA
jgi:hypothetical protein